MSREDDEEAFRLGAGKVVGSTAKALRVEMQASSLLGAKTIWVPKSVLHDDSEVFDALNNARGEVVVKHWFAAKEGWVTE